jgi:transposase
MPDKETREGLGANRRSFRDEREKTEKNSKTCEICGQRMEREPESGEYYCPDCYDADH